jgi:hypothetical protein
MYCPRCGATQADDLKFCKSCGANLSAVRQVVDSKETSRKLQRGKPWYAELAVSDAESKRRQDELDRRRGIAPEITRYNEIKAGIITGSTGLAVAIFLHVFMKGLILSGNVSPEVAEILSRLWIAGIIPLFVGIALTINGLFVSKKLAAIARSAVEAEPAALELSANQHALGSGPTTEFIAPDFSVTEDTTKHLGGQVRNR